MSLADCSVFILATLALLVSHGFALHLETSPSPFNALIHSELNITCISDGPAFWAKSVVTLEIEKTGSKPIAIVQRGGVQMGAGSTDSMEAHGNIEDDASHSFLTVTIQNPGLSVDGTYSCEMFYLDEEIQMQVEKASINVTVEKQDLDSVVKYLLDKVGSLEKNSIEMKKLIQEQSGLISRYEDKLNNQSHIIANLKDQDSYVTAFSFGYNSKDTFVRGGNLVFSDKILEVGDGYDPKTGVFTCQRDGIYVFHLLILSPGAGYHIEVELRVNGSTKSKVHVNNTSTYDQSSTSTVVSLKAADTVTLYCGLQWELAVVEITNNKSRAVSVMEQ